MTSSLQPYNDISIYVETNGPPVACMYPAVTQQTITENIPDGDSAEGGRTVQDFLELLRMIIFPDDFHLETLHTRQVLDVGGNISPGFYLVGRPILKIT